MLNWIREKFGTVIIGGIISFIAFVFIFYGVFSPKSTRGLHEGAVAGKVNDDSISISEYNRELNRRIEYLKQMTGGKLSDELIAGLQIRQMVFQELANSKLLLQESKRHQLLPSNEEVRERIRQLPAFQKDGKFDFGTYKQILEANSLTPGRFENMVRDDLSVMKLMAYFRDHIHVTDAELKNEFLLQNEKRNLRYVVLTPENAKNKLAISSAEITKFLNDPAKMNLAKVKFDAGKETLYKGKSFDSVKETIARNLLADDKVEEIRKINQSLAEQVVPLLGGSEAKVKSILKPYQAEVKTTGLVARTSLAAPEISQSQDVMTDAFAGKSPIDSKQGGKAKIYQAAGKTIVALVVDSKRADLSQLEKQRGTLVQQTLEKKSKANYEQWMNRVIQSAKIEPNMAVINKTEPM